MQSLKYAPAYAKPVDFVYAGLNFRIIFRGRNVRY